MLGIESIASYVPAGRVSNLEPGLLARFQVEEKFVRDKVGVLRRAVKAPQEETSDLACAALQALLRKTGLDAGRIQALVVVTQNPDTNLPHVSALVHGKSGLPERCAAFDVGLGCSGYVYGLSILQNFLVGNGLERGVLITADPYSKIVADDDKNTVLLFGDAATATLIGRAPVCSAGPFSFGTRGASHGALACKDGRLAMNGREVFNFAATDVAPDILALIERAELQKEQVDAFLLHQGSRYIVDTIRGRLGVAPDRVRLGLQDIGNTVSSSIPLLLEQELENPESRIWILSGFGVGLSWASCVCRRES